MPSLAAMPLWVAAARRLSMFRIAVGNWGDLKKALEGVGIAENDVDERSTAIQEDGKTTGQRVTAWIGRNAGKVFDHGLQLGTSVGTTVLTEYVKRHFGLP
jgi:hypothetical protein